MDSVIRNILDIDRDTIDMVRDMQSKLSQNDDVLLSLLESREKEIKEEAKKESDARYESIMKETQVKVNELIKENEERLYRLNSRYEQNKDRLAQELLSQLLDE